MSTVVFDVIHRYLEYRGYRVTHVMNYTDVEDKIIQRAREQGERPEALATRHRLEYERHMQDLNILVPTIRPQASLEMPAILGMIEALMAKGYAYAVDGDVYFRVGRDPDYGRLSGRKLEEMRAGARLKVDERKEDPADFALWKAAKEGEPSWPSPWGAGRPGWHIECSAMNLRYLGEQIDLHGGGNDLVFPHHENEIAQTESLTGKPFARYWVHNGMLQLKGEKMSKSLGNLVTVEAFLAEHEADAFRMMVLNSHYRGPLTYTDEVAEQAQPGPARLRRGVGAAVGPAAGDFGRQRALYPASGRDPRRPAQGSSVGNGRSDPRSPGRGRDQRGGRPSRDALGAAVKRRGRLAGGAAAGVDEFILGRNAVLEVLRAGRRRVSRVHVAEGARPTEGVAEILRPARSRQIPVVAGPAAQRG